MRNGMYTDRKSPLFRWLLALLCVLVVIALSLWIPLLRGDPIGEKTAQAIQDAVNRAALQCYVVEGVYPPDLTYLEEKYGLQINTRDYYVTYEAFASNLPPTVRVVPRSQA